MPSPSHCRVMSQDPSSRSCYPPPGGDSIQVLPAVSFGSANATAELPGKGYTHNVLAWEKKNKRSYQLHYNLDFMKLAAPPMYVVLYTSVAAAVSYFYSRQMWEVVCCVWRKIPPSSSRSRRVFSSLFWCLRGMTRSKKKKAKSKKKSGCRTQPQNPKIASQNYFFLLPFSSLFYHN